MPDTTALPMVAFCTISRFDTGNAIRRLSLRSWHKDCLVRRIERNKKAPPSGRGSRLPGFAYFFPALTLAHRALAAAAILARPAALIRRFFFGAVRAGPPLPVPLRPSNRWSSLCKLSILSLIAAALRNCFADRSIIVCASGLWFTLRRRYSLIVYIATPKPLFT